MNSNHAYIIFQLAGSSYAIPSNEVSHIELHEHVTPVPHAAGAVEGVVFSRGAVVPAINLRVRFGLPRQEATNRTRLIFLRAEQRVVALIVDAAHEFRMVPDDAARPMADSLHGVAKGYVRSVLQVGDRMVLVLDIPAILDLSTIPDPSVSV